MYRGSSSLRIQLTYKSHGQSSRTGEAFLVRSASLFSPRQPATDKVLRREYIALVASLTLVFLEGLISIITLALRKALTVDWSPQFSNCFQPHQSFDSAITDPRISLIYSPPHKAVNQEQNRGRSLPRWRAPRIL